MHWYRLSRLSHIHRSDRLQMQSVAVGESASSAMLRRDNGSKTQRWNCNRISHHCRNMPSWFARAICSYVCLKPDEYTIETAAVVKQSHSSSQQPRSPRSTVGLCQLKMFLSNVIGNGLLFSSSIIKATSQGGKKLFSWARLWHLSGGKFAEKHWALFTCLRVQ